MQNGRRRPAKRDMAGFAESNIQALPFCLSIRNPPVEHVVPPRSPRILFETRRAQGLLNTIFSGCLIFGKIIENQPKIEFRGNFVGPKAMVGPA
jgi:hypothetical protein